MVERITDSLPNMGGIGAGGPTPGTQGTGQNFADYIRDAAQGAADTMHKGEAMSMKGIAGEADLTDVVAALNSAETTLQVVTSLRDRMVQAYQEILRMPI
jgi:flagellar hook-basal body complex protein FliE